MPPPVLQPNPQVFEYDQLNRIQQAAEGPIGNTSVGRWGQSYTIDPWGNLSHITNTKGTNTSMSAQIDPDNNIHANTRDAAGNTTVDGLHTYTWDAESHLASLDSGASTYTYDANGMRVRKQTGSNWTEYVYFGGNVIAEKDQSGAWTDYIFAGGKRVAKAPGVASTSGTQFYHADHLGTARLMTDASGNVVAGSESTTLPYGEEYTSTPSATGNHYVFTGKERDSESGLDYFGARYYRSTSGRWLTPDWSDSPTPVPYADFSDPQSLNLYGYVGNRPITNADLDGHVQRGATSRAATRSHQSRRPPGTTRNGRIIYNETAGLRPKNESGSGSSQNLHDARVAIGHVLNNTSEKTAPDALSRSGARDVSVDPNAKATLNDCEKAAKEASAAKDTTGGSEHYLLNAGQALPAWTKDTDVVQRFGPFENVGGRGSDVSSEDDVYIEVRKKKEKGKGKENATND